MKSILLIILVVLFSMNSLLAQTNETKPRLKNNSIQDSLFNIEMIEIPAGTLKRKAYFMIHAMDIHIESFYIGKYEVTQKQWKEIMGSYPVAFNFEDFPLDNARLSSIKRLEELAVQTGFIGDDLPVENVSWEAIQLFVKKLSEKTGHSYRIPSDAEWEYAYRAGTTTNYYFGDDASLLHEYEWWKENSEGKTHAVGLKKPNPWGLYDMGGNVGEWCFDIADMEIYRIKYPNRTWPIAKRRGYRGSHYRHRKEAATASWGHTYYQVYPHNCVGFRLVREK